MSALRVRVICRHVWAPERAVWSADCVLVNSWTAGGTPWRKSTEIHRDITMISDKESKRILKNNSDGFSITMIADKEVMRLLIGLSFLCLR